MLFSLPGDNWPSWFDMAFGPPCPESAKRYNVRNWPCSQNRFGHSSQVGLKIDYWFLIGSKANQPESIWNLSQVDFKQFYPKRLLD